MGAGALGVDAEQVAALQDLQSRRIAPSDARPPDRSIGT